MKIALDLGHGCNFDGGALGIRDEETCINEVGSILLEMLQDEFDVVTCRPQSAKSVQNSLQQRCDRANDSKADLFLSLHFNKFNGQGRGTECYAISSIGRAYAQSIVNSISELGFKNRGVKNGNGFYVLKNTSMPAVLIEGCFIDSIKDMQIYSGEAIAKAIMDGILPF